MYFFIQKETHFMSDLLVFSVAEAPMPSPRDDIGHRSLLDVAAMFLKSITKLQYSWIILA